MNESRTPISQSAIFGEMAAGRLALPWGRTIEMCWQSLKNRRGRFLLVFISIAVVVALFVSTLSCNSMLRDLRTGADVPTKAALERAGLWSNNPEGDAKQDEQMVLLLVLSGLLCFVGVTNTIFMSVTERYREIGTLKCLGALNSFVVRLFMIESAFIGIVGSLMGMLAGFVLTCIQIGLTVGFYLLPAATIIKALALAGPLSVLGGTLLTLSAAIYPAMVAARMKPVDAMRVEV